MTQSNAQDVLPLVQIEMEGKIIVDNNTFPPDMVKVIQFYPNNKKEVYIKATVDAEVLSLHLQTGSMRVRIRPSGQYSFAGTRDVCSDPFFEQYKIEPTLAPQNTLSFIP